ncbi:MAG: hypothetical protein IPG86_07615 [Chitinophagaceae bacterium]|nr:hypothetical protein [Chitinophagaceae bacterium]
MKKISLLLLLVMTSALGFAQDSFQVVLHKKIVMNSAEFSAEKNVKLIKSTDWKKNGNLEVSYKVTSPSALWSYKLQFADEKEICYCRKTAATLRSLRKASANYSQGKNKSSSAS